MVESGKTWPGLNDPNVLGQVGAGGTEADDYQATTLQSNSNLFVCTCHKKKVDRVQDKDPQNTEEAVNIVTVETKKKFITWKTWILFNAQYGFSGCSASCADHACAG